MAMSTGSSSRKRGTVIALIRAQCLGTRGSATVWGGVEAMTMALSAKPRVVKAAERVAGKAVGKAVEAALAVV